MTTEAFWDGKHNSNDRYWLTGSTLPELARLYDLTLIPGGIATEVGVGLGACTRGLVAAGYTVAAVDVSQVALERVKDIVRVYHVDDLARAPAADLAICHLVFQHVADDEVLYILRDTRLAPGGVFAFQTAWMMEPARGLAEDMHGLIWHDHDQVMALAEQAGLDVFWERCMSFVVKQDTVLWGVYKARRRPA